MLSLLLRWTLPNAQSHCSCFIPLCPPMLCSLLPKCITQWGSVYGEDLHGILQVMTNSVFLSSITSLWVIDGVGLCCILFPIRLHRYVISCQNIFHLQCAFIKSMFLFLSLYKDFVSVVSTAPNNIVIVSLMNQSCLLVWAF